MKISLIRLSRLFVILAACAALGGCASPYLKGTSADGQKVYLGPLPIENTEAYQLYEKSEKQEIDKIRYLFKRFTSAPELVYYRDGNQYNWLEAYRGGMWLLRNKYENGTDARLFIRDHVWRSELSGKPHLVEFPDGSIHVGYYILLNELDLLEQASGKAS